MTGQERKKVVGYIQQLYAVERKARDAEATKQLRLEEAFPVANELGMWIGREIKTTLPKSQIGKAMDYAAHRWDPLTEHLKDGSLWILRFGWADTKKQQIY
ncbi:IS66 family transposase [Pedobacter sp.]|uniref:IS66 family transposase n=1 Tax=Pedobacter sp. TaxID=1411316 RepID=UPI003D7F31C0